MWELGLGNGREQGPGPRPYNLWRHPTKNETLREGETHSGDATAQLGDLTRPGRLPAPSPPPGVGRFSWELEWGEPVTPDERVLHAEGTARGDTRLRRVQGAEHSTLEVKRRRGEEPKQRRPFPIGHVTEGFNSGGVPPRVQWQHFGCSAETRLEKDKLAGEATWVVPTEKCNALGIWSESLGELICKTGGWANWPWLCVCVSVCVLCLEEITGWAVRRLS